MTKGRSKSCWSILGVAVLAACASSAAKDQPPANPDRVASAKRVASAVRPLHKTMGEPQPGDWLTQHGEDGQTFAEYLRARPVTPRGARKVLYVQPLGPFTETQRKIVRLSAEFMRHYFSVGVKVLSDLPMSVIPKDAQRVHPQWGMKQILSPYVLDKVLHPRLPKDALALIAFTAVDLYPEASWNFVFGQASLRRRVGVWSIYRNGDPEKTQASFRLCLLRTLKTATHETGHMLSIQHCIAYECNMCGCNNRAESDRRPVTLCPECLPKILWACGADAKARFEKLAAFCRAQGLAPELEFYERSLKALAEQR